VLLLAIPGHLYAAVSARLDRNTVYSGETVTLHITATGDDKGIQPDLAPLSKSFDVLGTGSSSQTQIINGKRSDKHEWMIELAPLVEGEVTVPAIMVGNKQTAPLRLSVSEQSAMDNSVRSGQPGQSGQDIFIRSEVNGPQNDLYVQQQIFYTTRMYYRIPMIDGSFSAPDVENAVVEQLGDDQQFQTVIDGQSYNVVERHYAIFPDHSGKLTIGPVVFTGRMESQTTRRPDIDGRMQQMLSQMGIDDSLFDSSFFGAAGKQVRLRSDAITLDIKPRPDGYTGTTWLPTPELVLQDSWTGSLPVIRAGEPVTRILIIEARGLEAAQLPAIKQAESNNLRIYQEQPELSNYSDGSWINGRSEQGFTYVATEAGKLTIPEVRIDWWDSVNKEQKSTVLPARDITVEPGNSASAAAGTGSNVAMPSSTISAAQDSKIDETGLADGSEQEAKEYPWQLLAAGGLGILLTLAALALWRRRSKPVTRGPQATNKTPAVINIGTISHSRKELRDACVKSDAKAAALSLLDWAAATWPDRPPHSLGAIADRVNHGADEIRELENALYSTDNKIWVGQPLWTAFKQGFIKLAGSSEAQKNPDDAPPLYPDWNKKAG
jgi:hypothetical protein